MKTKTLLNELSHQAEKILEHMKPSHAQEPQSPEPQPKAKRGRDRTKIVRAERVVPAIVQ